MLNLKLTTLSCVLTMLVTACSPENTATNNTAADSKAPAPTVSNAALAAAAQSSAQQTQATATTFKSAIFFLEGSLDPKNMFDGWVLMRIGAGEALLRLGDDGSLQPWLCQEYRVVDPLNYELTLRPDLTFSDGTKVTASDVKNCLERVMALNPRTKQYFSLDHITVQDDLKLTITTKAPVPELFYNLCEPLFCIIKLPSEAMPGADGAFPNINIALPVTTGPYQVTAFTPNQSAKLKANEHFRHNVAQLIPELEFLYMPEEQSRTMALQSGQVDLIPTVNFASLPMFERNPDYTVLRRISPRTNVVYINHQNEFLAQPVVRQALDMAIDRDQIVALIGGSKASSLIAPELVQGFAPNSTHNLAQAQKLLDDAGIVDHNGDGNRDFNGQEMSFNYYFKSDHGSADSALIAQCLEQNFKDLGVTLNLFPAENLAAIMASGDFDFFSANDSTLPTGDPYVFMHSRFHEQGDANFGHYHNQELESLLANMAQTFEPAQRAELTHQLLTELKEDVGAFFINHIEINEVTSKKVSDLHLYSFDYYFIDDQVRYGQ